MHGHGKRQRRRHGPAVAAAEFERGNEPDDDGAQLCRQPLRHRGDQRPHQRQGQQPLVELDRQHEEDAADAAEADGDRRHLHHHLFVVRRIQAAEERQPGQHEGGGQREQAEHAKNPVDDDGQDAFGLFPGGGAGDVGHLHDVTADGSGQREVEELPDERQPQQLEERQVYALDAQQDSPAPGDQELDAAEERERPQQRQDGAGTEEVEQRVRVAAGALDGLADEPGLQGRRDGDLEEREEDDAWFHAPQYIPCA